MKAKLVHQGGTVKEIKVGYSWTTFFFGFWVPVIRGQWSDAAILLISAVPTIGILPFIWTFKINKRYCQSLIEKGYRPSSKTDADLLSSRGYYFAQSSIEQAI